MNINTKNVTFHNFKFSGRELGATIDSDNKKVLKLVYINQQKDNVNSVFDDVEPNFRKEVLNHLRKEGSIV